MTATYSAFFSSGLLAPPNELSYPAMRSRQDSTSSTFSVSSFLASPSAIYGDRERDVSAYDDTSDVETEVVKRERTKSSQGAPKTVRRRRSSLSINASPMTHVRSPSRAVESSLALQRHLQTPSRSRSGSLTAAGLAMGAMPSQSQRNASDVDATMKVRTRMRSGSVGEALKSRRTVRRIPNNTLPPPSLPLPPLPPTPSTPSTPKRSIGRAHSKSMSLATGSARYFYREPLPPLPGTPPSLADIEEPRTPLLHDRMNID